MNPLQQKHILIGITGGIAAYKIPQLVRDLKAQGAEVKVVMTAHAKQFVTPLTLQAVSGEPVGDDLFDPTQEAGMGHIALARWADIFLVAPASANAMAQLAQGQAPDLLSTLWLATTAIKMIAPAMNRVMWEAPSTQRNVAQLQQDGVHVIGPESGEQACGEVGLGRMSEPETLLDAIMRAMADATPSEYRSTSTGLSAATRDQATKQKIVITAGATQEPLDPVRYISNYSSGKMGVALARAARLQGAEVILIAGVMQCDLPEDITTLRVKTALEMQAAVEAVIDDATIFIGAAAVSDYRCESVAAQKIKKHTATQLPLQLTLVPNPDIIARVASRETKPFVVGFAAETEQLIQHAVEKRARKNLDMIFANEISAAHTPFGHNENEITAIWGEMPEQQKQFTRQPKTTLAFELLNLIYTQKEACHDTVSTS